MSKKKTRSMYVWMNSDAYHDNPSLYAHHRVGVASSLEDAKNDAMFEIDADEEFIVMEVTDASIVRYAVSTIATVVTEDS
jgi:uncharacterized Zn finger protein